jgi:hypothetical protein
MSVAGGGESVVEGLVSVDEVGGSATGEGEGVGEVAAEGGGDVVAG